jgi:uncharacterized protein (TIGR03435 family)
LLPSGVIVTAVLIVTMFRALPGQSVEARQSFDIASIKPTQPVPFRGTLINTPPGGRFTAMRVTLKRLIQLAYQVQDLQISGGPNWIDAQVYNVEARQSTATERLTQKQLSPMLQSLLAERFKLRTHRETRNMQIYSMVVDKNGLKLSEKTNPPEPGCNMGPAPGQLQGVLSMPMLANVLGQQLGRIVSDHTGIEWLFDVKLRWAPDEVQFSGASGQNAPGAAPASDPSASSLLTAVREQLGLRLNAQKGPVEILVIDNAEKASEN